MSLPATPAALPEFDSDSDEADQSLLPDGAAHTSRGGGYAAEASGSSGDWLSRCRAGRALGIAAAAVALVLTMLFVTAGILHPASYYDVPLSMLPPHPDSFLSSLHPPSNCSCQVPPLSYPLPAAPSYFTRSLSALGYADDPLPQCTLLNYNFTLNLLHYVRYIQQPHVQADCAAYSQSDTCQLGERSLRPQWLVFAVDMKDGGGGYADRLKGLLSTFLLAVLQQRAFAIDNLRPLPWTDLWLPNALPWLTAAQLDARLRINHTADTSLLQLNYMGPELWQSLDHNLSADWAAHSVVRMRHNANSFALAFNNPHLHEAARSMGFDLSMAADLDYYEACFLQLLFRPTPLLADAVNDVMRQLGRPLVSSASPTEAAHRALQYYTSPPPASYTPLYCAQIRMGNGGANRSFTDTEQFLSPEELPKLMSALQQLVQARSPNGASYFLFVTSDSLDHEALIPHYFPSPPAAVVTVQGRPFHVDKDASFAADVAELRASYVMTVVSFHLLGECDLTLISRSGFGSLSQYRTRQLRKLRRQMAAARQGTGVGSERAQRDYDDVYIIENQGGKVVEFKHVRGSDGRERGVDTGLSHPALPLCSVID